MTLASGTKLGPYEILSPLGAGGMGEVYRARDGKLNRDVAIKVLPERLAADADALSRFEREAKAVAALSHPNILAIHDFGTAGGVTYAVMELLEGETLRGALAEGALPVRRATELGREIAARARGGAREGDRAPGPEARQRLHHAGWPGQDPRLRPGQGNGYGPGGRGNALADGLGLYRARDGHGHCGLHVAGAGPRPRARSSVRHLLVRNGPLRNAHGPRAVSERDGGRDDDGDPQGRAVRARQRAGGCAGRPRPDRAALPGEEGGPAFPVCQRHRLRAGLSIEWSRRSDGDTRPTHRFDGKLTPRRPPRPRGVRRCDHRPAGALAPFGAAPRIGRLAAAGDSVHDRPAERHVVPGNARALPGRETARLRRGPRLRAGRSFRAPARVRRRAPPRRHRGRLFPVLVAGWPHDRVFRAGKAEESRCHRWGGSNTLRCPRAPGRDLERERHHPLFGQRGRGDRSRPRSRRQAGSRSPT